MSVTAVILAAGKSTRMKTELPKVLHEVCGRPMLAYVVEACRAAGAGRVLVVVGYGAELVQAAFHDHNGIEWVTQSEQKGTAHAVSCCEPLLRGSSGEVLVLAGDGPLIRPAVLTELLTRHRSAKAAVTLATAVLDDPTGYGRIVRDGGGNLVGIVEQVDCTPEQRGIREVNPSYYCFDTASLLGVLPRITPHNAKGEFYLTDAVGLLIQDGRPAQALANVPASDVLSINTRYELAVVNRAMQNRILARLMEAGVTIVDPASTWVEDRVKVGADSVILPFTYLAGEVTIGRRCRVGPFAHLHGSMSLEDGTEWRP